MGSCMSSPEASPAKPSTSHASTTSPSVAKGNGSAAQMSNASGATPATQQANLTTKVGPATIDPKTVIPHGSAAAPIAGDVAPDTSNPMTDNDFTSALNSAPDSGSIGSAQQGSVTKDAQPARAQRDRSYAIDKLIEEDSKKFKKECKILLLGSGESGKSTIVKQMKIIHQNGYSREELMNFRQVVYKNLVDSAQAIILACRKLGVDPEDPANRVNADLILEFRIDSDPGKNLPPEIALAIESLWHDPIIPSVMDRQSEFYLMDSATYFFSHVRRISVPDYIPDEADVLRARTKTTGISETRFNMGQLSIHMFDVGGQRSERKKWIHCFEAVTSIIFCVALSEYDQVLLEESGQNRMQESLVLFESVINSRWFLRTSVILFLNKIDVFKMKLAKTPLEKYFPEYTGGSDINKAAKYILWRFTQTNRARLSVYPHLTQATDTSNIRLVFAAVKETILQNALRDSGIL